MLRLVVTPGRFTLALAALFALGAGCARTPARGLDPEFAACIPPGARLIAGVHLDQVRDNPVLRKSFAAWLPLLDRAGAATTVLVSYDGKDLLWIGRGSFREPPAGATLLTPQLAIAGSPSAVSAARAQHATGRSGVPALAAAADSIALQPIWAVISGGTPLPLSGNAVNFKRLLDLTAYSTFAVELNSAVAVHAAGVCSSAGPAQQLEETLRGMVTLARAATHDRAVAGLLASVQIRRDDSTVRVDVSGAPDTIESLLGATAR